MKPGKTLVMIAIVITAFLGAVLATDPRFVAHSELLRNPLLVAFLFGPTFIFAAIAVAKWRKGRIWPAAAFAVGLLCTGLFHKLVGGDTYGNPGYMVPMAHIVAPAVSLAAYLVTFLCGWIAVRVTNKLRRTTSGEGASGS